MQFSLQAIGHDPRTAGTPLGIWGGFTPNTSGHNQSLTRSPTYLKGGLGPFQILEFVLPFPPGLHPCPFWTLGIECRERERAKKDARGGYFGPPSSRCNWSSGHSGVFSTPSTHQLAGLKTGLTMQGLTDVGLRRWK